MDSQSAEFRKEVVVSVTLAAAKELIERIMRKHGWEFRAHKEKPDEIYTLGTGLGMYVKFDEAGNRVEQPTIIKGYISLLSLTKERQLIKFYTHRNIILLSLADLIRDKPISIGFSSIRGKPIPTGFSSKGPSPSQEEAKMGDDYQPDAGFVQEVYKAVTQCFTKLGLKIRHPEGLEGAQT